MIKGSDQDFKPGKPFVHTKEGCTNRISRICSSCKKYRKPHQFGIKGICLGCEQLRS